MPMTIYTILSPALMSCNVLSVNFETLCILCFIFLQVNFSRQVRPDMKTHLDRPLVVDPHENRNNNTNKMTANNPDLCFSQQLPVEELHRQTRLHDHGGQVGAGCGVGSTDPAGPPLERGESTESRRGQKGEHHHHGSHVRLDATAIPRPGSEDRPSRRHHHTRSGSRSGGQSEHRKSRSHRKCTEDGEEGRGGAVKTGRHRTKGVDGGGETAEQDGAVDGGERRQRRSRHLNQMDGEGRRTCQHRRK